MSASSTVRKMRIKFKTTVLEKFLFSSPLWQEGYRSFSRLFGRPGAWFYVVEEEGGGHLVHLDRKGASAALFSTESTNLQALENFHLKYGEQIVQNEEYRERLPTFYKSAQGKLGAMFGFWHLGKLKGLLFLTPITRHEKDIRDLLVPLNHFLTCHAELAYKNFELNNFYETVHPRALALSTIHSVHRVISSSLRLNELLPRIGRLSAQVLKAKGCSIMLVDPNREFLLPYFSFGANSKFIHRQRVRIGRGLEGRIVKTGEFHLSRRSISVPFIEDDVVGLIVLWDKIDNQPFTKIDLEILKSLSEQAVVAIKNAQLYEETEQLTLGSIKTINELLELNLGGDQMKLPVFGEIIIEVGKEMGLSGKDLIQLGRAVLLLDTGALAFPQKVWHKKGKLTKKEFELIKRIPLRGADLLKSITSLKPVIPIILHHRERYDGRGYPEGLRGEEIPIGARIVSVVDSFVAMISERAYREPMTIDEAAAEIQSNRATQFDPRVVDSFLKVIRRRDVLDKLRMIRENSGKEGKDKPRDV
jgi:hypothetical protein